MMAINYMGIKCHEGHYLIWWLWLLWNGDISLDMTWTTPRRRLSRKASSAKWRCPGAPWGEMGEKTPAKNGESRRKLGKIVGKRRKNVYKYWRYAALSIEKSEKQKDVRKLRTVSQIGSTNQSTRHLIPCHWHTSLHSSPPTMFPNIPVLSFEVPELSEPHPHHPSTIIEIHMGFSRFLMVWKSVSTFHPLHHQQNHFPHSFQWILHFPMQNSQIFIYIYPYTYLHTFNKYNTIQENIMFFPPTHPHPAQGHHAAAFLHRSPRRHQKERAAKRRRWGPAATGHRRVKTTKRRSAGDTWGRKNLRSCHF